MRIDDLLISLSYFSIPIQLAFSLFNYNGMGRKIPGRLVVLMVLFILFILLCGCGHMLRALELHHTPGFDALNWATCVVSVTTAVYLLPVAPSLLRDFDESMQALVTLNEETAASKRKLFTFMSFLCHEIRNPLFAITSNIEFALDMIMSQEVEESLQSINQSASLMLRLVNDVLDLSKIESGKLQLEEHEFDIREFFQNLASSMSLQVQAKRNGAVKFVFNMSRTVPRIVKGDSVRVLQIAYNILSNACKFTEEGTITFSLDVQHRGQSAKQLVDANMPATEEANPMEKDESDDHTGASTGLQSVEAFSMSLFGDKRKSTKVAKISRPHASATRRVLGRILEGTASFARSDGDVSAVEENNVRSEKSKAESDVEHGQLNADDDEMMILRMSFQDTGTGIPTEQLERIFQPYAQSKLSDFRKHGGTGLGLSIISKLLEMMGGTVKVFSELGEGSTFVIHLPLRVPRHQYSTEGKSGTFATTATTGTIMGDTPDGNYMPMGSDLLEDVSNRNMIGAPTRNIAMHDVSPETSLSTTNTVIPEKLDATGGNANSSEPSTPVTTAQSAPSPLFGIDNSNNQQPGSSDAKQAPLFGVVTRKSPAPGANTPAKPPDTASVPLFGVVNATQPAPLFGSTSALPSNSIVSSSTAGPGATPARIAPQPPVSAPAATKVRQLAQFHFEKNSNLVLVTDDNAVNRKLLSRMLTYFNLEFKTAENGQVAVDIMKESRNFTGDPAAPHYGMVLMDLSMPVMDGYEAILTLRKNMMLDIPIVALTANAMEEEKRKSLENGATEFATKPILRPTLHAKCVLYLSDNRGHEALTADTR